MSLTTSTHKSTIPISTFKTTTKGVVETGTLASVSVSFSTGVLTTIMATAVDTVLYSTTINGTPHMETSLVTNTRKQTGMVPHIQAISYTTRITLSKTSVLTKSTTVIVPPVPTNTATTSSPLKSVTSSAPINTGYEPLASTSRSGTATVHTTTQPSTTGGSLIPTTTIMTMTTITSSAPHPSANAPYVMPPMNMHTFWWIPIVVIFTVVGVLVSLWLWRRCARKSFDRAVHFLHATFETTGGIIFGKRWVKWKAIRDENRRKKAEIKNRQGPLDEHNIRNVLLRRWNETAENHRRQGTMPEHNSPPSTASGGTWRKLDRDTLLSNRQSEPLEMKNLESGSRPATNSDGIYTDSSQGIQGNNEKRSSREVPSSLNTLFRTASGTTNVGVPKTEIASPLPLLEEGRLNALAPWPEQRPEAPHPGIPWQPSDSDNKSLVSHNQWFPREDPRARLLTQVQGDVERNNQTATGDIDTQSSASFRGARGVWGEHSSAPPQPSPNIAASVNKPPTTIPPPALPSDHPILRVPSPKPLPTELPKSFNQTYVFPMEIYGPSPNQDRLPSSKNGVFGSLLGRKKPISRKAISAPIPIPPNQQPPPPPAIPSTRPHLPTRRTSNSSWTDATIPPTERPTSPLLLKAPRVPGWYHPQSQSVTSAYSGIWEDEAGGKIKYDRNGRIRDVEFQGGARVPLAGSEVGGEGEVVVAVVRGGNREEEGEGSNGDQHQHQTGGTVGGDWI